MGVDPEKIRVGEVVRQLEPTLEPVNCETPQCKLNVNCKLRSVFDEAVDAYLETLDQYNLAQLAKNRAGLRKLLIR